MDLVHEMGVVGSFTTEPLGRFAQAGGAVVPAIPIICRTEVVRRTRDVFNNSNASQKAI